MYAHIHDVTSSSAFSLFGVGASSFQSPLFPIWGWRIKFSISTFPYLGSAHRVFNLHLSLFGVGASSFQSPLFPIWVWRIEFSISTFPYLGLAHQVFNLHFSLFGVGASSFQSPPFPIWGRRIEFSISTFPYLGLAHRVFNLHFCLFGVGASSFQSPHSPVLCCFYLYLFLLCVFSYNITPPQFRSSYLSVSTLFHAVITTSSSVFLSTWPNNLSLASLIFSLMHTYTGR